MLKQIKSVDEIANPETVLLSLIKECQFDVHFELMCEDLSCRSVVVPEDTAPSDYNPHPLMMRSSDRPAHDVYTMYCVLRLPIQSPIRLLGFGATQDDARYSAARNALHYLRLMSLKDF